MDWETETKWSQNDYRACWSTHNGEECAQGILYTVVVSCGILNTIGDFKCPFIEKQQYWALLIGSSIVILNGIFQKPTTANNSGNNYGFNAPSASATDIVFTGITSANGSKVVSQSDINLNQLPRGGVIVSLGSTNRL